MSNDQTEAVYRIFLKYADSSSPSEAVKDLRTMGVSETVIDEVAARHEAETIRIRDLDEPRSVWRGGRQGWYLGPNLDKDKNWPAIVESVRAKGFSESNIQAIDDASSKIVYLLDHPKQESFRSRGLVIGFVQSGKTTNFTAVMAKAADRGYKLFIVLSGIHNALRRQTQLRLADDLIVSNPHDWHEVTTAAKDFSRPGNPHAFFASRDQHVLLVVKKNATVLRKLRDWLAEAQESLVNCPTLIIDDEADQSTVATKKINPLLHQVLSSFPKVSYIGYTATPFANLLINPADDTDFYPKDFIVNLPQPNGYQGTEVLFGRTQLPGEDASEVPGGYDMIRHVPDDEVGLLKPANKQEAMDFQPDMCPSLRASVEWFWLATAARRVRGRGNPHSTMLVHTTTYTAVHERFTAPLLDLRADTLRSLQQGDDGLIPRLRSMWIEETERVAAGDFGEDPVEFERLLVELVEVVQQTKVVIDNYRSQDRLDYESGPVTAIAVGGNTLSRGLTLEGLVSSLFVRAVSAYDTLLQMGRWFGYRQGYADLPRIWMTGELHRWFSHLGTVEAEMRQDVDRYMNPSINPMNFAVRLRDHPQLAITAKAKMTSAIKAKAAYGGQLVESRFFDVSAAGESTLRRNAGATRNLISRADRRKHSRLDTAGSVVFNGVPHDEIVEFLESYEFHERSAEAQRRQLVGYVQERVRHGALGRWSVAVIGNSQRSAATPKCDLGSGVAVRMVRRARLGHPGDTTFDGIADIKTLSSARDTAIDVAVPPETFAPVARDESGKRPKGPPVRDLVNDHRAAQRPGEGLLLIYPIEPASDTDTKNRVPLDAPTDDVVIGVAILFPKPEGEDSRVEYWSAKLPGETVEEEDTSVLDQDDA